MGRGRTASVLVIGLFGATAALAQTPPPSAKHRHAAATGVARSAAPPATGSTRQLWDNLVKGSPEQQAAERKDNELAGVKPIDHRKDEFFSDWRGLQ